MTSIIVDQNSGHNLIEYFGFVKPKKKALGIITRALHMWCQETESNCRHEDFQTKFFKIQKCSNWKQL